MWLAPSETQTVPWERWETGTVGKGLVIGRGLPSSSPLPSPPEAVVKGMWGRDHSWLTPAKGTAVHDSLLVPFHAALSTHGPFPPIPLPTPRFTRRKGLTSPPHQLHSRGSLAGGPFLVITLLVRGPFGPRGVERDSEGLVTSVPLETLATHPATKGKGNVGRDRSLSSFIPVPSTPNRRQESKVLVGWIGLSARTSPHSLCSFAASHSVALERVYYPTSVTMEGRGSHMTTSFITWVTPRETRWRE